MKEKIELKPSEALAMSKARYHSIFNVKQGYNFTEEQHEINFKIWTEGACFGIATQNQYKVVEDED